MHVSTPWHMLDSTPAKEQILCSEGWPGTWHFPLISLCEQDRLSAHAFPSSMPRPWKPVAPIAQFLLLTSSVPPHLPQICPRLHASLSVGLHPPAIPLETAMIRVCAQQCNVSVFGNVPTPTVFESDRSDSLGKAAQCRFQRENGPENRQNSSKRCKTRFLRLRSIEINREVGQKALQINDYPQKKCTVAHSCSSTWVLPHMPKTQLHHLPTPKHRKA